MSNQSHYQQLGITEDASFEEIQAAKERLKQKPFLAATAVTKSLTAPAQLQGLG